MKFDQSLKLVPVKKPKLGNPIVQRREKLLKSINNQVELLQRYKNGEKANRIWFWKDEDGNIFLPIKYGKVVLELGKGKFAIQCGSVEDIKTNLEAIKSMVSKGDFDEVLDTASTQIRKKFGH